MAPRKLYTPSTDNGRPAKKTPTSKGASSKSGPSKSGTSKTGSSKAGSSKTGSSKAGSSKAGSSKAGQSKSGSSKSGPSKTGQPKTEVERSKSQEAVERVDEASRVANTHRPGRTKFLAVTAGLLSAVLVALVAVNTSRSAGSSPRESAPRDVSESIVTLLSYEPSTVGNKAAETADLLTGDFAEEYSTMLTDRIAPAAEKAKVTADAEVVARSVVSSSKDRVVLLLFVNVSSSRAGTKGVETQGSRLRVTAERVDGTWRVSDFTPI